MTDAADTDEVPLDGRCFTYVFPCAWEDYGKIGFSNDPLARIRALHPRWFEFFDLDAGAVVEAETQRDARDLELMLRRPLRAHRAPAPLTVAVRAGGKTEWVRGANAALAVAVRELGEQGHRVYRLRDWTGAALRQRVDRLYEWAGAQLPWEQAGWDLPATRALRNLRDVLDSHEAMGVAVRDWVPAHVWAWYRPG